MEAAAALAEAHLRDADSIDGKLPIRSVIIGHVDQVNPA